MVKNLIKKIAYVINHCNIQYSKFNLILLSSPYCRLFSDFRIIFLALSGFWFRAQVGLRIDKFAVKSGGTDKLLLNY